MSNGTSLAAELLQLDARARAAHTLPELAFTVANETWRAVPYRQALVWRDRAGRPELLTVSGLSAIEEDSPFTVWVDHVATHLWAGLTGGLREVRASDVTPVLRDGWSEWWPEMLVVLPFSDSEGSILGAVFILPDAPLAPVARQALEYLAGSYAYCWQAIAGPARKQRRRARASRWTAAIVAAFVLGAMFFPVHMAVLAPAEAIALRAIAITSPIDGVIKELHVQPNQAVRAGEALFTLDDTTLRNRREVAAKSLAVADAELRAATQKSFDNLQSRTELSTLTGRVAERRAELVYVEEQLRRIAVTAPRDGIAVFGDVNDWIGKPVATGERIVQLAAQEDAGLLVFLPVADAINLEPGAQIRFFLHVAPLEPIEARLTETSYQVILSPEGVAAYRIRAEFKRGGERVRIGLKGTARLLGEQVTLGYYLLRRPLAALREWSGW